jgi:hypothetical protein
VPTLIHWRLNGVSVAVRVPTLRQTPSERAEMARRTLLTDLGCEVSDVTDAEVWGFFFKAQYWDESAAIVVHERTSSDVPLATRYQGGVDASAVQALHRQLPPMAAVAEPFTPSLIVQDADEVIALIRRGVHQYRSPKVELRTSSFSTRDLRPLSGYARAYKYRQIEHLYSEYCAIGQEPFTALAVLLRSGKRSIVTPPVVEVRDAGPVIIEGTTRAAYCFRNDIAAFACVAVTGVAEDLPGDPMSIVALSISERSLSPRERTENYQQSLYRQIERATHPY